MKRRILTLLLTLVMVLSLLPGTALAVNDSSAPAVTYAIWQTSTALRSSPTAQAKTRN